jgi:hypothetical protein
MQIINGNKINNFKYMINQINCISNQGFKMARKINMEVKMCMKIKTKWKLET